jgi:hypothetical protein
LFLLLCKAFCREAAAQRRKAMTKEDFPVVYANLVQIGHSGLEFLLDFKRLSPEAPALKEAPMLVRVILHPAVAKSFRDALADNIGKYEGKFGEIPTPPQSASQHDPTLH